MEQLQNIMEMLDLMVRPAFCVRDGLISGVNGEARRLLIPEGIQISGLLKEHAEEFQEFREGCLYTDLWINGHRFGASVTRQNDLHIVVLEPDSDQAELNALALAAQELRGPLNNVLAAADWMFPKVTDAPETEKQAAQINRGLYQMLRIISNMSDAALYSQNTPPTMEIREITGLLEDLFEKAAALIAHNDIRVTFRNLPNRVFTLVNEDMLERAIYNILSNAVMFTPKGGTVEAVLIRRGSKLYLTVQDSGTGVAPDLRATVHARYLRQPGIEDPRHGIGLGMVLIRSAAAAHGGTVLLEHPEGQGTRITFSLTIRVPESTKLHAPILRIDYAGERDHGLLELSDTLPAHLYKPDSVN